MHDGVGGGNSCIGQASGVAWATPAHGCTAPIRSLANQQYTHQPHTAAVAISSQAGTLSHPPSCSTPAPCGSQTASAALAPPHCQPAAAHHPPC